MVNKRILIFGIIAILGISLVKFGTGIVKESMNQKDDDLQIVKSDDNLEVVEEEGLRKTVLYFKSEEGYLVPVMKRIPWDEGIAKASLLNMVDSSELRESLTSKGLEPILPVGTKVNGITIDEATGLCKVDFSEELKNVEDKKDEENLIKGVVYTLTEFPSIKEVKITVEGEELSVLHESVAINKPLSRENINVVGNIKDGSSKVVVYYKGENDLDLDYFIPVTVPTMAPQPNVYTALDLMLQGPPSDVGLKSDLPKDLGLAGVEIKDNIAYVDITSDTTSSLNEKEVSELMKNIGLTLGQFKEIKSVEVLLNGKIVNTTVPAFANEY
ncbi:GerMN domain-containing protein [Tissierella creatinophila]|uniref:Spore germination protein GerM n=1 Tax=Tissierella creatinophila DSM 6911 TaxID=1123403 RepID=A0A1U7M726_TISCR|nr:GerMN domain-containing protein [Tissierella creatinophila]OLS03123.1 spore germination protein GerM [Tissierella creatinophila DSM 6911]